MSKKGKPHLSLKFFLSIVIVLFTLATIPYMVVDIVYTPNVSDILFSGNDDVTIFFESYNTTLSFRDDVFAETSIVTEDTFSTYGFEWGGNEITGLMNISIQQANMSILTFPTRQAPSMLMDVSSDIGSNVSITLYLSKYGFPEYLEFDGVIKYVGNWWSFDNATNVLDISYTGNTEVGIYWASLPLPSDLLMTSQFASLILTAILFSMMYEVNRDLTWSGIIAAMTWLVMGMYYFVVFAQNPVYTIGLFFVGIGLIYIVRFMADLISMRHADRRLAGDERY